MSGYTIGEIVVWLLLAAILGFVLGWLLRSLKCNAAHGDGSAQAKAPAAAAAPAKAAEPVAFTAGAFPLSAKPLSGGAAPSAEWKIKGNEDSMIYHTPESRTYGQTIAEIWFRTEADAKAAGFRAPKN